MKLEANEAKHLRRLIAADAKKTAKIKDDDRREWRADKNAKILAKLDAEHPAPPPAVTDAAKKADAAATKAEAKK